MGKKWVKLYCKQWLDGSMSYELTDAQVGIWSKLLALAGEYAEYKESDGFIPLPLEAIRRRIKSDPRTFDRAIERLKITERLELREGGIFLTNFNHYNPTRSEIWDAENPGKAYLRKLRYEKDTRLSPTTSDGLEIDKDKELDKEIDKEKEVEEDLANIIKIYEENIGMVTPLIGDQIKDALSQYPASWVGDAIKRAVDRNKRSWGYIEGILRSWHTDGKDDSVPKSKGKKDRDKFIEGGYSESVCRTEEDAERLKAIREDFKRKRGL